MSKITLRSKARILLSIANYLKLAHRPQDEISLQEIERAASRRSHKNCPSTSKRMWEEFVSEAVAWLSFLNLLQIQTEPAKAYDQMLAEFREFMEKDRGLSPATVENRCHSVRPFLDRLLGEERSLDMISVADIDSLLAQKVNEHHYARMSVRGYASELARKRRAQSLHRLSLRWQPRINRTAMTRRAVDKALVRLSLDILHLRELLVDHLMHDGHFARRPLLALAVTGEILWDVAVGAGYAERVAVSSVHDVNEIPGRHVLEPGNLDVLENVSRRLFFPSGNAAVLTRLLSGYKKGSGRQIWSREVARLGTQRARHELESHAHLAGLTSGSSTLRIRRGGSVS